MGLLRFSQKGTKISLDATDLICSRVVSSRTSKVGETCSSLDREFSIGV